MIYSSCSFQHEFFLLHQEETKNITMEEAIPWTAARQVPLSTLSPGVCSNSCPLSWWCYLSISSSATPFSFCLQSFPASGSFPMSQLFTSGSLSTGASTSASVLPINIQGWFPLELTALISLLSKRLSRVFSSTKVQKQQFKRIKSHGQRSLVDYSHWGHKESDMTERLTLSLWLLLTLLKLSFKLCGMISQVCNRLQFFNTIFKD